MTASPRTWRFPRLPLGDWAVVTLLGWVGLLLCSAGIAIGIDRFDEIMAFFGREGGDASVTQSIWVVITNIAVWYTAFSGGFFLHQHVPAYIAHGRTRRDSTIEAFIFTGCLAVLVAVLGVIGFALEHGLYAIGDWPRGVPNDRLADSYTDYGALLVDLLAQNVVFGAAGMLVGAGFYRDNGRGWLAVGFSLLVISLTGIDQGTSGPFMVLVRQIDLEPGNTLTAVLAVLATVVLAFTAWQSTLSVPLRNK